MGGRSSKANLIIFEDIIQKTSPLADLNLGIIHTYLRRYLIAIGYDVTVVYLQKSNEPLRGTFNGTPSDLNVIYVSKDDEPEYDVFLKDNQLYIREKSKDRSSSTVDNIEFIKTSPSIYYDIIISALDAIVNSKPRRTRPRSDDLIIEIYDEQHTVMSKKQPKTNEQTLRQLKSQRRVKNELYEPGQCHLGVTSVPVEFMLAMMFGKFMSSGDKERRMISLLPYCNEKLLSKEAIDRVNRPYMSVIASEAVMKLFNVQLYMYKEIVLKNDEYSAPHSSVNDFLTFLRSLVRQKFKKKPVRRRYVIVSHGNFMRQLVNHLSTEHILDFDNLDVIRIDFTPDMNECYAQLKYKSEYKQATQIATITTPFSENIKDLKAISERTNQYFYIVRHCVACHNLKSIGKTTKLMSSYSGDHSMCTIETVREIEKAAPFLKNLFDDDKGTTKSRPVRYGSSIIFRAVLTCTLLQAAIENIT